jgi:ABC-2 type transport system permease protein
LIRAHLEIIKKSFQNNIVYRADYFFGVLNTLVLIFVNISIWKAIYEEDEVVGGIQFKIVITYVILGFLMQCIFTMDDYFVENRVRNGLIASDILKPVSFRSYILSYSLGTLVFRVLMQLLPVFIVSIILFGFMPPFSPMMALYFLCSMILGYLVLYSINFIIWICSFWFYRIFSLVTIKDAAIMIFSGAILPLWFMPQWLVKIIKCTPFDSIYFTPISIYLGQMPNDEIYSSVLRQIIWVLILSVVGQLLWKAATKKLVVQGG